MQVTPLGLNFALFLYESNVDPYPAPKEQSFKGYNSALKKAFLHGDLGDQFIGIYGQKLDKNNYSVEHIIPISKGGSNKLGNQFLADRTMNSKRGNDDIGKYITFGMFREYVKQFEKVKTKFFDVKQYIADLRKTMKVIMED